MKSKPGNYIILLDALRHDYINSDLTPFLSQLKANARRARVIESYGFQTRPAFFAGLEPDQSDICNLFRFDPKTSPFKFIGPTAPFWRLLGRLNLGRGVIRRIAKRIEERSGYFASASVLGTEEIPIELLPYFAPAEREFTNSVAPFAARKTIFDLLRSSGKSWNWVGYPRHFGSTQSILSHFDQLAEADLHYLHFSELDWLGHKFGPLTKPIVDKLLEFDTVLRDLLEPALERGDKAVMFGDHGMVQVEYKLDLLALLKNFKFQLGRDYIYFLDSTQARFWFFKPEVESVLRSLLQGLKGGRILELAERIELGINFKDNSYFELIFAIDGPGIIHPSFFSSKSAPLGMHGYLPNQLDNQTQVFAAGSGIDGADLGTIKMVQIYDLLVEVLGLGEE